MTLATWIETAAKGRLGGPVRAGMWSAAVIGTHPVQDNQRVSLELCGRRFTLGSLPAYWIENKGGNSFWHAPIPPQAVGARLHYRAIVERDGRRDAQSAYQDTIVRPNLAGPHRVDRFAAGGSGRAGRQPVDDDSGRCTRLDLRRLFSDGRPSFVRPAQGRRPAPEPLPFSRDHRRPRGRPPARLVHGTGGLGPLSAISGGNQPPDDQADLEAWADPGP